MLYIPSGSGSYGLVTPSYGTTRPAVNLGTYVTPGSGTLGSYASLGTLTEHSYGITIIVNSVITSVTSKNVALTIATDESGGTSYTARISDLICGSSSNYTTGGIEYYFPLFIPSGSKVAAAAAGSTTDQIVVTVIFYQKPPNPMSMKYGSFTETFGMTTATAGTSITPGTTNEGSWTSIGTTAKRCWWWQIGVQVITSDTVWSAGNMHIDLAVGDATNKDIILTDSRALVLSSEALIRPKHGIEYDVPAGSTLYIRAQYSVALDDGYNFTAYGLGG